MRDDVRDALELAINDPTNNTNEQFGAYDPSLKNRRRVGFHTLKLMMLRVLENLPDGMTLQELADELNNASSQHER